MRIELQENGIKVKGENLNAGDIFCIDSPFDAFVYMNSPRLMDVILDAGQADNFIYDIDWDYWKDDLFMAFSVKDNSICLFPKDRTYIQLEGKMVLERY